MGMFEREFLVRPAGSAGTETRCGFVVKLIAFVCFVTVLVAIPIYFAGAALQRDAADTPSAGAAAACARLDALTCAASCACGACNGTCVPAIARTPGVAPLACAAHATWVGPRDACSTRAIAALFAASVGISFALLVGLIAAITLGVHLAGLVRGVRRAAPAEPAEGVALLALQPSVQA